MVTKWPEAAAMRLSSDQASAFGKEGEPINIAGCNGLGWLPIFCGAVVTVQRDDGSRRWGFESADLQIKTN